MKYAPPAWSYRLGFAVAAFGSLYLCFEYLGDCRDDARAAEAELAECRTLATRIRVAGGDRSPRLPRPVPEDLPRRITHAAAAAGVSPDAIADIRSEAAGTGVAATARVTLQQIELRQLIRMLQELDGPDGTVRLKKLHLETGRDSTDSGAWRAELVIAAGAAREPW